MYVQRLLHRSRINFSRLAVMLIILGLSGCQITSQVTSTPTVPVLELTPTSAVVPAPTLETVLWQENWLKGIPCRPPCWEGIVPGKTTVPQAVKILKELPFVSSETIVSGTSSFVAEGELSWGWRSRNVKLDGRAFFENTPNQTIRNLQLIFPTQIYLGDVIATYGEPTQVEARATYDPSGKITSWLNILYIPQGFGLTSDAPTPIEPNLHMISVFFFPPDMDNFAQLFPDYKSKPDLIVPWQGYQSFEFYCRDDDAGKACQGAK